MHKLKIACLILLAILLTAVGGLLPVAATRMQDITTANVVRYEDIEALRLRLEEEAPSMSYQEKIFLMMHGEAAEIRDESTQIKEKEIIEAIYSALTPYMEIFFGKSLDNDYMQYAPVMAYDGADPSRHAYYWYVNMSLDASSKDYISLILDDETGKLLAIDGWVDGHRRGVPAGTAVCPLGNLPRRTGSYANSRMARVIGSLGKIRCKGDFCCSSKLSVC